MTRWLAAGGVCVLLSTGIVQAEPVPTEGLTARLYRKVEAVLKAADRDRDGSVDDNELSGARRKVEKTHGKSGIRILERYVDAADTNDDGRITAAEWQRLGNRIPGLVRIHQETVHIEMADGVTLATEIWRPSGDGAYPVILQRTPYGRNPDRFPGQAQAGYVVVRQDMRGRFDSTGENLPFIGCGWAKYRDGVATVKWLRQQSWCNGRVGTVGGSAGGITQNLLAGASPEGLACQYISVAAASLYHHAAYVGGALRWSQVDNWLRHNEFSPEALRLYRGHHCYDAFWHDFDSTRVHPSMSVPAMHVGGWFDTFSLGTVSSFMGRQHHGAEGARGTQKLVMGPWAHGGFKDEGQVGELSFPTSRQPHAYSLQRWLDHFLKGTENGVEKLAPVAYFVMGDTGDPEGPGNEWRYADDWPVSADPTPYILRPDGRLVAGESGAAAALSEPASFTFDPADPCPTVGGCNLTIPAGPMDQRRVEQRDDMLVYTSEALENPLEVTGHIQAILFVDSSAKDTDLSVRFCDVYPDGRSMLMAEGMQRVRFRAGLDREVLMAPGQVYRVVVDLWPTSIVLNREHRIRIDITASNYPRFDVNPGTGVPGGATAMAVCQTNRIHCSEGKRSRVILPVVPGLK